MTAPILLVLTLGIAFAAFWQLGKRPHAHKNLQPDDVKRLLGTLLRRGFNQGFLVLDVKLRSQKGQRRFIQFTKYIRRGQAGLQFDFPLVDWSTPYYAELQSVLRRDGFSFVTTSTGRTDTREFLTIDFGSSIDRASQLANVAIEVLVPTQSDRNITGFLHNVSARDTEVTA